MNANCIWVIGVVLLTMGCDREPGTIPSVEFTGSSDCKNFALKSGTDKPSDQDCIQYKWVNGDTLKITHINAGFNCCPEGFRTELKINGDTLVISESENEALCDCNCLFDLEYFLTGIGKDTWWIRINEQYINQTDYEKIQFKVDLDKQSEGEFCVSRTNYPWRM